MRRFIRWTVLLGSLLLIEPATAAVLTTITLDGNMGDWGAVLADPKQASFDGPAVPLPDLDSPSAASRDLTTFGWAYDPNNLFASSRRAAATSGRQRYLVDFDTDTDTLPDTGPLEPGAMIEFSHDCGTSFDVSDAASVTHVRWTFSTPLGVGSSGQVAYQAVIP